MITLFGCEHELVGQNTAICSLAATLGNEKPKCLLWIICLAKGFVDYRISST
jgi:hypothetical protein